MWGNSDANPHQHQEYYLLVLHALIVMEVLSEGSPLA